MGSGNTKLFPPRDINPVVTIKGETEAPCSHMHIKEFGRQVFKVSSAIFCLESALLEASTVREPDANPRTNPNSEFLAEGEEEDDYDEFESIVMGAISNQTIRGILKKELHTGAFAAYLAKSSVHATGPYLEFLSHVMNIEVCMRSVRPMDVVHREFVKLYDYYKLMIEIVISSGSTTEDSKKAPNGLEKETTKKASVRSVSEGVIVPTPSPPPLQPVASVLIFNTFQSYMQKNQLHAIAIEELPVLVMRKMMRKSQEEILGLLAVPLAEYILSPEYEDVNDNDDDCGVEDTMVAIRRSRHLGIIGRRASKKKEGATGEAKGQLREESTPSSPYMEDIEASVSTVLMARYREACMSRFNLDVMTPRSASATNLSGKCSSAKSVRVMAAVRSACKKQVKEEGDGTGAHSNAMTVSS